MTDKDTPDTNAPAFSLRGRFLLATPGMGDPRFRFGVIYIVNHDDSGAMGIVLNKGKKGLRMSELLDQIGIDGDVRVADTPVLSGGPVDLDRGFVLHSLDWFRPDSSLKLSETLSLTSTKDVLRALVSDNAPSRAVLAIGYAGWGPGQLEAELSDNAWLVADADEAIIFDPDLAGKWNGLLSDMGIDPSHLSYGGGRA